MLCTGARILLESLKREGVDLFFGYPGGAVIDIYDELSNHPDLRHILVRHEQGAVHAADGYARACGKVGVCLATSGPGATNTVTGIATAYSDSIPMVIFTGQVSTPLIGNDAFQEVDIIGITRPCTKHNFLVKDVKDLAETVRKAFYLARSGRPGPVLVDIPKNIQQASCEFVWPEDVVMRSYCPTFRANLNQLRRAMDVLVTSRKPLIVAGGGVIMANAAEELCTLAHLMHAPVCSTLMGLGAFPGDDPLWIGMLGMHGTKTSNLGVSACDLLIAIGTRFSDRVLGNPDSFAKNAKILQIDIDPAEINKNIMAHTHIIGDIKAVLTMVNRRLGQQNHNTWVKNVMVDKVNYPLTYDKSKLSGPQIVEAIYERTKGDAVIVTEVGQHQMWAAQFYKYKKPRTFLTSGGLGTMGYGLGASIGAKVGSPEKTVINIAGDGCFRMNLNELATATRYNIPIIEVIINNSVLGMVRQWQNLFYSEHYSYTTFEDPVDFVKVAEGMGALAKRVTTLEEFEFAFEEALEAGRPVVLDCHVDLDDKVWPMVNPGAAIQEAYTKEDLEKTTK